MFLSHLARRLFRTFAGFTVAIILICAVRTVVVVFSNTRKLSHCTVLERDEYIALTDERWETMKKSLTFRTISYDDSNEVDTDEFKRLLEYIIAGHPTVFQSRLVTYEIVANYSLLIRVQGKDKALLPYMLAAHLDVVPVVESQWSVDPFSAVEDAAGTLVYGRGTLDDKGSVMAHLAALEFYLARGRVPDRSFFLAYGHDEEIMGNEGATAIARTLSQRGVNRLHFVLDEGLLVLKGIVPGTNYNLASIGVTEKGFMDVNVTVEYTGGHSSMPNKESAVSILAKAVEKLHVTQMPAKMDELADEPFKLLAPVAGFPMNVVFSNLWLFRPIMEYIVSKDKSLQGIVRTTRAPTIFQAGTKSNVIPSSAWAIVNHRIHPRDSKETVLEHLRWTIDDDRVRIVPTGGYYKPHPVSPFDRSASLPYQVVADTAEQLFEDTISVPGIMIAATDTKHYLHLSENIYRFNPILVGQREIATIHAEDEFISRENYQRMINFYYHLFINADRTQLGNRQTANDEL